VANNAVVGILRTLFTADTSGYIAGFKQVIGVTEKQTQATTKLTQETQRLTPQAERMVKAWQGDKIAYQANNIVAAITKIGGATRLTDAVQARNNATLRTAIETYARLGIVAPKAWTETEKATRASILSTKGLTDALGPLGPTIAATFSIGAVIGFTRSLFNSVDALTKLHDQTGISFQGLQKLQIAADDAGNSIEDITQAINQFQNRLGDQKPSADFVAALKRLGFTVEEIKSLSPERQFMEIGDALKAIKDPAEQVNLVIALMGRTGAQNLPTLKRGFEDLRDKQVGMSDDSIRSIDELGDAWKRFSRVFSGEAANIAAAYLNVLFPFRDVTKTQQDLEQQLADQVKKRQDQMAASLPGFKSLITSEDDLAEAEKHLTTQVRDSIAVNQERLAQQQRIHDAINDLIADVSGAADKIEKAFDDLANADAFVNLKFEIDQVGEAMQRIAEETDFLPTGSELERLRNLQLLAANPPGTGVRRAAQESGETIGGEMKKGIGRAFEDVPHFLISSVLHSGSFINGLKALGVSMADAISEPLIKAFAMKIAGARLLGAFGGGALGLGAAAGGSAVASEVAGTAAATSAAVGGGAGGGIGAGLAGFFTNPITGIVAGAAVGVGLLIRHLRGGPKANELRDKDLAQFGPDDLGHRDANNPPGFYGLARFLDRLHRSDLFQAFIHASNPDAVRKSWQPIMALAATQGRTLKSFEMGGWVPPGVVQPALLHGGLMGEKIVPLANQPAMSAPTIVQNHYWQAIDGPSVQKFVNSDAFTYHMGRAMEFNTGFMTTRLTNGQKGMR